MSKDKLTEFLAQEERVLQTAKAKAMQLVAENPTAEHLRALREAERSLSEYNLRQTTPPAAEIFPRVADIHRYILSLGYRITKQTIFNHKKKGMLTELPTGGFSKGSVDAYIEAVLSDKDEQQAIDIQKEKSQAELKKIRAQADHWTTRARRERRELIEVSQIEKQFAARVTYLRADLERFFNTEVVEIVKLTKGDISLIPDAIDYSGNKLEEYLARYSRQIEIPDVIEDE